MFEKEKKYFPKVTDPQCQLKWNWSTLWLNEGTTNSCHRCLRVPLDPNNFDNFHNLPHKIKEREIMLSGKYFLHPWKTTFPPSTNLNLRKRQEV